MTFVPDEFLVTQADKDTDEVYAQMTLQPVNSVSNRAALLLLNVAAGNRTTEEVQKMLNCIFPIVQKYGIII
jgi:hypothetical protein